MLFQTELLYLLKIKDKNKIMILTGKAKESFIDYLDKTNQIKIEKGILNLHWQDLPEIYQNSLIIEWFDSVGIYVNSSGLTLSKTFISDVSVNDNCEYNYDGFRTRKEATEQAIKKANEIYNSTL